MRTSSQKELVSQRAKLSERVKLSEQARLLESEVVKVVKRDKVVRE